MTKPPDLPGVTHRYHELSTGIRAHVAHAGPEDAPKLLALHGFPQHFYIWRRVIAQLRDEFHILAMDTRGLGWSSTAPDYRKERIADDALALLDALDIQTAGLLGHDWGAWAGFHAVLKAPERFSGYVATGIAHPWASAKAMLTSAPRFLYQPPLATPFLGPRIIPTLVPRMLRAGWGDRETYDRAAEPIYAAPFRDPQRAEAGSRYYRDFLLHEALRHPRGRLRTPTRLLQGARDPIGTSLAEGLERHGDDARTVILEGCGHFVPEERPGDVARAVRELLP